MMDWDKLRVFHAVASAGSFTHAGDVLHLSQSAISRQVSVLEENLKVSLFHRHARGLKLTEQGDILFRTVDDVLNRLSIAENALLESKERPQGPLKITAPVALGTNWLTQRMSEFTSNYPEIAISMLMDDRELDLAQREADVAIRLFPAKHPDLIQTKLTVLKNSLYASNDYLLAYGVPQKVEDLQKHKLIVFGEDTRHPFADANWLLKLVEESALAQIPFKINTLIGIFAAAKSGMGIAALPDYMAQGSKNLTKLLPEINAPKTDVYLVHSEELKNSKRISAFKEFLLRKLAEGGLGRTA